MWHTESDIHHGAMNLRLHQALKELNDLTHVDLGDYTEEEYEYRGELLSNLYAEFRQAGYRAVYDTPARSWKLVKEEMD